MTTSRTLYPILGALLEYHQLDVAFDDDSLLDRFEQEQPKSAKHLRTFVTQMKPLTLSEREEIHTRTFDVLPSCDPYVSSQLFGQESYQRGTLMAGLLTVYEAAELDCAPELPDHIGVILRFAESFSDEEWEDLVRLCLWGAVSRMVSMLCSTPNPYTEYFQSVLRIFESDVPKVLDTPPDTPLRVLSPANSEMGENNYA